MPPLRILTCGIAALMVSAMAMPALAQTEMQAPVTRVGKALPRDQARDQAREQMREVFEKKFFDKVDTDRDNVITREEFRRQADERFDGLDTNRDGKLTRDEVRDEVKGRKHKRKN